MTEEDPEKIKIIFMGLNNAGKTSIILSFLRRLAKILIIKPTKSANTRIYEFLGTIISEWDFGGQRAYRQRYLKSPEKYFMDTDILVYVIDTQDSARTSEALNFLIEIMVRFKGIGIAPSVYVFFHKFDPASFFLRQEDIDRQASYLENIIVKILNLQKDQVTYYRTSIFDLPNLYKAMSEILLDKIPSAQLVQDSLMNCARKMNLEGLVLIDNNSLIESSYYRDSDIKLLIDSVIPYFLEVNDRFQAEEISRLFTASPDDHIVVQRFGKFFLFIPFKLKEFGSTYYFLSCSNNLDFNKESYDTLINLIKDVLKIES
jgi:GTPase SAR1 family protein